MFSKLIRNKNKLPRFIQDLDQDGQGKLALFDADGTLWTDDVADDFTRYALQNNLLKHGDLWDTYLEIYAKDPAVGCPYLLQLYKDVSEEEINKEVEKWWINDSKRNWVIEVMETLYYLAEHNYTIWVVTGSPTAVMLPLLKYLPIDKIVGIDFDIDEKGLITGEVKGIICSGQGKADKVRSINKSHEILFACGNSSMDIPMMELSQKVIWSVFPNEKFFGESTLKKWFITPRPSDFIEEEKFIKK